MRDASGAEMARAEGVLSFTPDAEGLRAEEIGALRLPDLAPIRSERQSLWRAAGAEIAVFFGDGKPFHRFDPAQPRPEARHDCTPDLYRVSYDFSAWPLWSARWRVTGPRKDYTMLTRHARDSHALASVQETGQETGNEQENWEWPGQ